MAFLLAVSSNCYLVHALGNNWSQVPWQVPQLQLKQQHPQSPVTPLLPCTAQFHGLTWAVLMWKSLHPWHRVLASNLAEELLLLEGVCKWQLCSHSDALQTRNGLGWLFLLFMTFYASMRNSHEQSETETCSCVFPACSCEGHAFLSTWFLWVGTFLW